MSRAAFEGLPPLPGGARQDYVPGDMAARKSLAEELVATYLSVDEPHEAIAHLSPEAVDERLTALGKDDSQAFLDSLIASLAWQADRRHAANAHILLSPAINALHARGCDSLSVDLTPLATPTEYPLMHVSGSGGRQLELTLKVGDPEGPRGAFFVGHYLKHCSLHLIGSAQALGQWGEDAEFLVEGIVPYLGHGAKGCAFMLPLAAELISLADGPPYSGFDDEIRRYEIVVKRAKRPGSVFLDEGYLGMESHWLDDGFFRRGNTLLIPDCSGGWQEVKP